MKSVEKPISDVGVIVGRFQVHELHEAHIDLIKTVSERHSKTIVFLGLSPCRVTRNNPLDFESRKQMILDKFPNVIILYVKDTKSDTVWSKELDEKIGDVVGPSQTVTLYGSRDSFIRHYEGKHHTEELVQEVFISGSEIRKNLGNKVKNTPEFRAGVIWAAYNQYPKVHSTVDIAIFDESLKKILLGRKPDQNQYRFIGGFAEPGSESYEEDARREAMEEAVDGEISNPVYVGSFAVSDWRYKYEVDKIKTSFFAAKLVFGRPRADDDIVEVRWFDFNGFDTNLLVEDHKKLWERLVVFMKDRVTL